MARTRSVNKDLLQGKEQEANENPRESDQELEFAETDCEFIPELPDILV